MIAFIQPLSLVDRDVRVIMTDHLSPSVAEENQNKSEVKKSPRTFPCEHCEKILSKPSALGGHVSRMHKGMSASYNRNQTIRKQREKQRVVNGLTRKLMSHIYDLGKYKYKEQLVKDIRSSLMTLGLSDLAEQKVDELSESQWFI